MADLDGARVGVIGGSGLYSIPGLCQAEERTVETPFGAPSDPLRLGEMEGVETVFLARHGRYHNLLPSEVPYRANIWAMRSLGSLASLSSNTCDNNAKHPQIPNERTARNGPASREPVLLLLHLP